MNATVFPTCGAERSYAKRRKLQPKWEPTFKIMRKSIILK